MGGAMLSFEGESAKEVREKLNRQLRMAKAMGLSEEGKIEPFFDEEKQVWRAGAFVHS